MRCLIKVMLVSAILTSTAWSADEYRVESIDEPLVSDAVQPEIADRLAGRGLRVVKGEKRTVCELWFCKQWETKADFKATSEWLYPFTPGDLIGIVRLRRRGSDFRDQDISRGVYTLRYGLQPSDGNHEGTSPTRDFLLMVRAEDDASAERMPAEQLETASAEAAGSNHPAMLCLQRIDDDAQAPALREIKRHEWWVLRAAGTTSRSDRPLPLDLVVVGHGTE